ncbi:MAG: hypothetical protein JO048_12190, partial [Methylobacteriaceae bacterium]|nr:hypothetical protein [Methylobacteriaceae bacterium]
FAAPAAVAVYLVVASGWPFADAALLVGLGIGGLVALRARSPLSGCLPPGLAAGIGIARAAPAWMPLVAAIGSTARFAQPFDPHVMQTPLLALLAIGAPLFPQPWTSFGGEVLPFPPMQYAGWWLPLVALHAAWSRLRSRADRAQAILVLVTLAFGCLAVAPSFPPLRWSFRYLPYFQIGCAVAAAWFMSQPDHRWTARSTVGLLLGTGALAGAQLLATAWLVGYLTLICLAAALLVLRLGGPTTARGVAAIAASHVALFGLLTGIAPRNAALPDWRPPLDRAAYAGDRLAAGDTALLLFEPALFRRPDRPVPPDVFLAFPHGNTALLTGSATIAGYSPMAGRGFHDVGLNWIGASQPDAVARWLRADPLTGANLLDLARIVRVTAQTGPMADSFERLAGPGWTRREVPGGQRFERAGSSRPGSVSWAPPGLSFGAWSEGATAGRYELESRGGPLVWARAWYPGYEAAWNGAPLAIDVVHGILPAVTLPPGPGTLTLRYIPAGLRPGLAVAALALAALGALLVASRLRPSGLNPLGADEIT